VAVGGEDIRTAPEIGARDGVGALLRDRRIELGLELPDVADALRIRRTYLAAIENGRLDDLPGHIYAVGFIRTYAGYLGFEPEQVLERFKQEAALAPQQVRLNFPPPPPESRAPRAWMIILGLLVAALIYGVWEFRQRIDFPIADLPPPVATPPAPVAATPPAPTSATSAPVSPPPAGVEPAPPGAPPPAASGSPPAVTPPPAAAAPAAAGTPPAAPPAPAGQAPASDQRAVDVATLPPAGAGTPPAAAPSPPAAAPAPAGARVVIRAVADSWLTITGSNNEVLVPGRVLRPGDTLRLPERADALLWTGNLGGLEVLVDDKPVPRLGNPGEAKRNVSLDPARLLGGTAVPR